MKRITSWILGFAMLVGGVGATTAPLSAQNGYYNGMRRSGTYNDRYDRQRYDRRDQGGIGPGKGALIGGAGGAALGALFGGGLKGALIGGAAGAGVGALAGKAAQNNRDRDYRERYDRRGRRY
jgi:hypothetical protein